VRILFDARRSVHRVTGIGRIIDGLIKALAAADGGHEYLVVYGEKNPLEGATPSSRFEGRRIHLSLNSLRTNELMPQLARGFRADVAYFPFWLTPLRMPCPMVVAIHDLIHVHYPEELGWPRRLFYRGYLPLVLRAATRVHTLAAHGARDLAQECGVAASRIDVVSPGVDDAAERQDEPHDGRFEPGVPSPFCLYVGNHKPHKNLANLLRAYARISSRMESHLVIVGARSSSADPLSIPQAGLSRDLGLNERVHFLGQIDDGRLWALLHAARFLVLPSRYEGFGLPALEAMARGTPVACSNTTSLPEVVGDAARMFDPEDVVAIAEAMLALDRSSELRRDLAARGRIRATRFSWTRSAAAWLASLERACAP
jgi:alpha-1,3-rhamnosyl/mannosyltransferase